MLACVTLPLALSGDQWLAFAGVLSGVIVGGGGLVFAYFNGKEERARARRTARAKRPSSRAALRRIQGDCPAARTPVSLPRQDRAVYGAEARPAAAAR